MKSKDIFLKRLVKGWKYQLEVFHTIADWTVMLYIIIPSVAIFLFIYRSWWLEIPSWAENLPFFLLFFLFYLLSWSGNIRTFLEEGDKVFLIKNFPIFWGVKRWGYFYSIFIGTLLTILLFIVILPFLLNHYMFQWNQLIVIVFYFISIKPLIMFFKYHLGRIESRWKNLFLRMILFISISWFTQFIYFMWEKSMFVSIYLISALLLVLSIIISFQSLKKVSYIDHEIEFEQEHRTNSISLIFRFSFEVETPVVTKRTKPFLLRKSKRLFKSRTPVNGFMELYFKMFLRNNSYLTSFLQITSITIVAMFILPALWLKILILICILIMTYIWLSVIWNKIMALNPQIRKYKENNYYYKARSKATNSLFLITSLILILISLVSLSIAAFF